MELNENENLSLGDMAGMGEVSLPSETSVGSGDIPAGKGDAEEEYKKKRNKKKQREMKNIISFESFGSLDEGKTISSSKISMMGARVLNKISIGTIFNTEDGKYEITDYGRQANAFKEFEAEHNGKKVKVKLTAMYGVELEVTDDVRSSRFNKKVKLNSIILESINEVGVNVWYFYKKANKNKNKFFKMLSDFRKKHSDTAWIKMLNYALEDFNENPKKYKTIDDKQNILFKNLQNNKKVYEGMMSTIDQIRQDSKDVRDFVKNVFKDREFKKMSNDKDFIKYLKSIYEGTTNEDGHPQNWMSGRTSDYHTALRGKNKDYSGGNNFKKKNHGQPDVEEDDEDQETNHLSNKQTHIKSPLKMAESGKKKSDKNYKDWKSSRLRKEISKKLKEYGQRLDLSFIEDEEAKLDGTYPSTDAIDRDIDETAKRDYKDEYKKFQS